MNVQHLHSGPANDSVISLQAREALQKLQSLALDQPCIEARKRQARNAVYIAGKLALKGQITVFYAGPNTGKTLLCLRMLADARAKGSIQEDVYHINLDDDFMGATNKAMLGLQHGFRVITPERFTHPLDNFRELIGLLVDSGAANKTIFVLDTIKKFADVMDKKAMTAFITECRKLTAAGGSIIALAHTNKIKDDESKVIPGGTSDLLDDCDGAYVLHISGEEPTPEGLRRYVTFDQLKSRGPTVREALYSYEINNEGDYTKLFNSVRNECPEALEQARQRSLIEQAQAKDTDLIQAILSVLAKGECNQTGIVEQVRQHHSTSRNAVKDCLSRWNMPEEQGGLWCMVLSYGQEWCSAT